MHRAQYIETKWLCPRISGANFAKFFHFPVQKIVGQTDGVQQHLIRPPIGPHNKWMQSDGSSSRWIQCV